MLVTGYQCSPYTVDAEFLLAKQQYADIAAHKAVKKYFDELGLPR